MGRLVAGVDVGFTGALAIVGEDGSLAAVYDAPTAVLAGKRQYLPREMANQLRQHEGVEFVAIERQQAYPKQGGSSSFRLGEGYGLWQGIASALGLRLEIVEPTRWKRWIGIAKGSDKDASRLMAQRRWPERARWFERKKDDGRADAALIAAWGRSELLPKWMPEQRFAGEPLSYDAETGSINVAPWGGEDAS